MTMTDEPDSLDELLSRYLDGDATEAEAARIESEPALLERVAQLRAAAELVAAPVVVPIGELDRIRAIALAASTTTPAVADLAARRAERAQIRTRVIAAAAAFIFLAIGFAALRSSDTDDSDTAATATDDAATDAGDDSGDDAFSLSGGADGDDMADADADEMAADDDMAADAEMAEADTAADDTAADDTAADGAGTSAPAEDVAAFPEPLAILPADLGAVANLTELETILAELRVTADAEARFAPVPPDPFDGLCDGLVTLLLTELPSGVLAVEVATVEVSGLPQRVAVATAVDGTLLAILIADDACEVLSVLEIAGG